MFFGILRSMKCLAILLCTFLFAAPIPCRADSVLRTPAEMERYIDGEPAPPADFAVTTVVSAVFTSRPPFKMIYCEDNAGAVRLLAGDGPLPEPGDVIAAAGQLSFDAVGNAASYSNLSISVIGRAPLPKSSEVPLGGLDTRRHHNRVVVTEGDVVDVIADDISHRTVFLLLKDGPVKYPVAMNRSSDFDALHYLGARARVRGVFLRRVLAYRPYSGPFIDLLEPPEILTPPPDDPFSAPPVQHYPILTPQEVAELPRRSEVGWVLATWNGSRFAMRTPKGKIVLVQMLDGVPPPDSGDAVKVVGYPASDLFRINLTRAITRHEPDLAPCVEETPETVNPELLTMEDDHPTPNAVRFYHGRTIRYRGVVTEASGRANPATQLRLRTGSALTTVNAGTSGLNLGAIPAGSEVEVTGVCVLEGENWTSERIFPHLRGFMLVLRTDRDLEIVRNPPWWTTGRLTAAILVMLAGMIAVILWNRYLKHLVDRRGNELAREKFKMESAQLKIGERTRLAVELHDSLSQNLEGVACQVAATRTMMQQDDAAASCLDTAQRMLDSCRLELRRCLFDLRGHALEEKDLSAAIRTTLAPICAGVNLEVRFDVRRSRFDDTTIHATLCIIRELVSNAIRHGRATRVQVAGEYHGGELCFSVRDNGEGFDPSNRAGTAQGHFGLDGVRERAERLDGSVLIDSAPGRGTRVAVTLACHGEKS